MPIEKGFTTLLQHNYVAIRYLVHQGTPRGNWFATLLKSALLTPDETALASKGCNAVLRRCLTACGKTATSR